MILLYCRKLVSLLRQPLLVFRRQCSETAQFNPDEVPWRARQPCCFLFDFTARTAFCRSESAKHCWHVPLLQFLSCNASSMGHSGSLAAAAGSHKHECLSRTPKRWKLSFKLLPSNR
jgi:hypothetical protein